MKVFITIGAMLAVSLLQSMENDTLAYVVVYRNCKSSGNIQNIKHLDNPIISKILKNHNCANNYIEYPNTQSNCLPKNLKNFKVKSTGDLQIKN
ncbi:hypothetical protein EKK58_03310 [Candidatus Dependentiae bacterium]|nr:MAG: hypothetical protein EKK58_03310 [Candidatus Dependentiae bacterium]